jgi:hypothetical protein
MQFLEKMNEKIFFATPIEILQSAVLSSNTLKYV